MAARRAACDGSVSAAEDVEVVPVASCCCFCLLPSSVEPVCVDRRDDEPPDVFVLLLVSEVTDVAADSVRDD